VNPTRILVVDDEQRLRRAVATSLAGHGYAVEESETGGEALAAFYSARPDLVLLDLMLPDMSGVAVCHELRRTSDVPIIVLSVLGDEAIKVKALDEGADDYLTKPFGSAELLARIRAALRRFPGHDTSEIFEAGELRVDLEREAAWLGGNEVRLTPTEFALLRFFVLNAGKVLRHPMILRNVWGAGYETDTQVLRTYVNQLRTKLGDDRSRPRFIRTEPGVGYRFIQSES
jgi:two-component system KDP operon response regulator KdpE